MKFHDGMVAVVDEANKKWLGIATRKTNLIDILTMGFWPKPTYEQIGTYSGNDSKNFKSGDKVKITFYTDEEIKQRGLLRRIFIDTSNIKTVERYVE